MLRQTAVQIVPSLRPSTGARSGAACATGAASPVAALLALPEDRIRYLEVKLAVDASIDPALDLAAAREAVEALAEAGLALAGGNRDPLARLAALRRLLHEAGPWNDHRPFAYDMVDPLGRTIRNKLLPVYLATRRGNCVSMPILFLILGERMGLDLALATAPHHVFVRHDLGHGRVANLETTSGAWPARDEWYRRNMPMTDAAIANGLYMRSLPRREAAAVIAGTIMEQLAQEQRYEAAAAVAEAILGRCPRDVAAMLHLASACGAIAESGLRDGAGLPVPMPLFERLRRLSFARRSEELFARAEALGWRPEE